MLLTSSAIADSWLVIPAQIWNGQDGMLHRPTYIKRFPENYWDAYSSHVKCVEETKRIYLLRLSPNYSMCTEVEPDLNIWR